MTVQIDSHGETRSPQHRLIRHPASSWTNVASLSICRRLRTVLRRGEEGSTIVEIALFTPILLGLLTAICTFAVGFNNQLNLTTAVGAGAQYLQLIRVTTSDPCADTMTAIENAAPSLTPSNISLTLNLNGTVVTGTSCPGAQSNMVQGQPVTVSATSPCILLIMNMGFGTKFTSNCQLSAQVTEYEY